MSLFKDKVEELTSKLNSVQMSLCDIILGYEVYWFLAIKHVAVVFHLSQQRNILRQFHFSLLTRIKFNGNFPCVLIPIYPDFGGLGLKTLELEQGI